MTVYPKRYELITVGPQEGLFRKHQCLTHSWNSSCEPRPAIQSSNNKRQRKSCEAQRQTNHRYRRRPPRYHSEIKYYTRRNACIIHYYVQKVRKTLCDTDPVNKHLTDARLDALGNQDEEPNTSENVEIHDPKEYHTQSTMKTRRTTVRKNMKHTWYYPSDRSHSRS